MNQTSTLKRLALGVFTCSVGPLAHADFIKDSHATLALRNMYLNHDYRDQPGPAGQSKTEEWGQGFMLNYTRASRPGAWVSAWMPWCCRA